MKYCILLLAMALLYFGCEKPPSYSNIPSIHFVSMTPTIVRSFTNSSADAANLPDSVLVTISFTDGNGQLGVANGDTTSDAYLIDSRPSPDGNPPAVDTFSIPYITPNGNVKAISGTINFSVAEIVGRPDHPNWDTLHYTVYIKDRQGHLSNPATTSDLYIKDN